MGHQRVADVLRELREDVQRALLQRVGAVRDALEQERQQLGPLAFFQNASGELADGVARFAHDGSRLLFLQNLQQLAFDAVLRLLLQVGPQTDLVFRQHAPQEN